ncbi:MAG TPA: 2-phospho-L-lactate guanylyltransferase, partial [Nocardioides sp.]
MSEQQYAVVVPVKPPAVGKSRLAEVGGPTRQALAEAFALDTVTACAATGAVARVLVVTDDVQVATAVTALGAVAIPDGVSGDLNATLRQAAAEAVRRWPTLRP